ncbi:MAG: M23 family metallopeptidase, partial [Thermosynechococcaceae cyanobacterium]
GAVPLPSTPTTGEIYQDASPSTAQPIAMRPNKLNQAKGYAGTGTMTVAIARRAVFPPALTLDLPPLAAVEQFLPSMTGVNNGLQQYIWPAKGAFTSGYGWRWGRMHRGIDIAAPIGTPIVASAAGVVVSAGWNDGGYGNLVKIRHPDGSQTLYAHNNSITARVGMVVNQGELIAYMGTTGRSTGPHCHFEIRPAGQGAVDPMFFLSRG